MIDLHENETALKLVLEQRHKRTRKWPIVRLITFWEWSLGLKISLFLAYGSAAILHMDPVGTQYF